MPEKKNATSSKGEESPAKRARLDARELQIKRLTETIKEPGSLTWKLDRAIDMVKGLVTINGEIWERVKNKQKDRILQY